MTSCWYFVSKNHLIMVVIGYCRDRLYSHETSYKFNHMICTFSHIFICNPYSCKPLSLRYYDFPAAGQWLSLLKNKLNFLVHCCFPEIDFVSNFRQFMRLKSGGFSYSKNKLNLHIIVGRTTAKVYVPISKHHLESVVQFELAI